MLVTPTPLSVRAFCFGAALLVLSAALPAPAAAAAGAPVVRLGMDTNAISQLAALGAPAAYASFWVGPWMATYGWGGLDGALDKAKAANVAPVVYWYYWGDSISPACVDNGCDGRSRAQWDELTTTLAERIRTKMGGAPVIVVLENEFNKQGIESTTYAPKFDALLEAKANELKAVPGVRIALGYGAWGEDAWGRFPKALAASDMVGFQMMRGQTRDSEASYRGAPDKIASLLSFIQTLAPGKRALLYDLALSSYPDAAWERAQGETLQAIVDRLPEYAAAGLDGIIYRELYDNPNMSPANYFGYAEQHWGLRYSGTGAAKPAWSAWLSAYSRPAAENVPGAFEAEAMIATTGGRQSESGASGEAVWNVWTNGEVSQRVQSAGGSFVVTVVARGTSAGGVDARMELRVDGVAVASWSVAPGALREHVAEVALPAGAARLSVAFTNDALVGSEDRNLLVDVVRVEAPRPNAAPAASFVIEGADLAWAFDGRASSDPDGDALTYAWAFGDGAQGVGATATHAYAAPGRYTVTLTVSDGRTTASTTRDVVAVAPNRAPTASFTTTGSGLSWSFDARASTDPDGDALSYQWTFHDGATATGPTATRAYAAGGTYAVTLTVTDARGAQAFETRNVTATAPPAYRARQAEAFATRDNGASFADASAQDGVAWLLWSNGGIHQPFQPGAGKYRVEVLAKGDPAAGEWPILELRADNVVVARWTVASSTWQKYAADVSFAKGETRTLSLVFVNDHWSPTADRNVRVDALTLSLAPVLMQAEAFATRSGGMIFRDAKASGGKAWLQHSNGAIAQAFAPGSGPWGVEIVARGDYALGWPTMELRADGASVASWSVASSSWSTYRAQVSWDALEGKTLSVHYTNDQKSAAGDRNLRVDTLRLAPLA